MATFTGMKVSVPLSFASAASSVNLFYGFASEAAFKQRGFYSSSVKPSLKTGGSSVIARSLFRWG